MLDAKPWSIFEAADCLQGYHIPLAKQEMAATPAQATVAAGRIGYPVALKGISAQASHKSEAGLVQLNLCNPEEVEAAAGRLLNRPGGQPLEGLLVQEMVRAGVELIAGISHDPQFGPVVMVGSGGVLVELLGDVATAVPPLTRAQALAMIEQTKAARLLRGYRGQPAGDVPALVELVVNLARLALDQAGKLSGLDLNPVIVLPAGQGVKVVDFRIYEFAAQEVAHE